MANTSWNDLSTPQRLGVIALGAAYLGSVAAAHIDLTQRGSIRTRGPRILWRFVTLIPGLGPVLYYRSGRR